MTRRFGLAAAVVAAVLVGSLLVGAAAAQTTPPIPVDDNESNTSAGDWERIDASTWVVSTDYNPDSGTGTITLYSTRLQEVTITDSGGLIDGGQVAQRSVTLRPDSQRTIEMRLTAVRGFAGVSVATPSTLYAVPIEPVGGRWFDGEPTWGTVQIAGLGSTLGVVAALSGVAWKRRDGGAPEVTRKA